jgi:hypothetical protein
MSRLFQTEENFPVEVCLTDKYPNRRAFAHERMASLKKIHFSVEAVDATQVPGDLNGFRTIFTSFRHFRPKEARAILQNAVDNQEARAASSHPAPPILAPDRKASASTVSRF